MKQEKEKAAVPIDEVHVRWALADGGELKIRKWSQFPFEGATRYSLSSAAGSPPLPDNAGVTREDMDAWLQANCGVGIPFREATDESSMMHGLAYILRQIESTRSYSVHIGQCGPATSALRMALDHFARAASAATTEASE